MSETSNTIVSVEERVLLERLDAALSIESPPTDPIVLSRDAFLICQRSQAARNSTLSTALDVAE
jgi:hypothetical protein